MWIFLMWWQWWDFQPEARLTLLWNLHATSTGLDFPQKVSWYEFIEKCCTVSCTTSVRVVVNKTQDFTNRDFCHDGLVQYTVMWHIVSHWFQFHYSVQCWWLPSTSHWKLPGSWLLPPKEPWGNQRQEQVCSWCTSGQNTFIEFCYEHQGMASVYFG